MFHLFSLPSDRTTQGGTEDVTCSLLTPAGQSQGQLWCSTPSLPLKNLILPSRGQLWCSGGHLPHQARSCTPHLPKAGLLARTTNALVARVNGRPVGNLLEGHPMTSLSLCQLLFRGHPAGFCGPCNWSWPIHFQSVTVLFLFFLLCLLLHSHGFWKGLHTVVPAGRHTEVLDFCWAGAAGIPRNHWLGRDSPV